MDTNIERHAKDPSGTTSQESAKKRRCYVLTDRKAFEISGPAAQYSYRLYPIRHIWLVRVRQAPTRQHAGGSRSLTLLYPRGALAQAGMPSSFNRRHLREGPQPAVAIGAATASYRSNGEHVARAADLRGRPCGDSHPYYRARIEFAGACSRNILPFTTPPN